MWKILTAWIREEFYYSLLCHGLFPEKQKGCHRGTRGTNELLCINLHILIRRQNEAKKWLQKGLRDSPANVGNIQFKNTK